MSTVKQRRATRASLTALGVAAGIEPAQVYLLTDEGRLAVGLTSTAFEAFAKQSEASLVYATVAEVWAASVTDKVVAPKTLNDAMIPQALAITAGVVSPDCNAGINFDIPSINANITIANLANKAGKLGRSGSITGKNDATAGRTVSLGTDWKKIGTTAFPTAANSRWKIVYNVDSNGVNYSVMVLVP